MAKKPKSDAGSGRVESDYTQKEAEDRRDAILKKMLSTPPKPKKVAEKPRKR